MSQLKGSLENQVFVDLNELTVAILEQVNYLEKAPSLVQAFLNKEEVAYVLDQFTY